MKPRLLVSVRSADEAMAAARGGAAIIDIKEPANGPLGRAPAATIRQICETLNSAFPERSVSVALGEITEWNSGFDSADMTDLIAFLKAGRFTPSFVKLGLAGSVSPDDLWQSPWMTTRQRITSRHDDPPDGPRAPQWIAVAYADCDRARSPEVESVVHGAVSSGCSGVLVDTYVKDNSGLRDWLTPSALLRIRELTQTAGLWLALAGRVSLRDLAALQVVEPDIIAVRGAVCERGSRTNAVQETLVRGFVDAMTAGFGSGESDFATINDDDRRPGPESPEPVPSRLRLP